MGPPQGRPLFSECGEEEKRAGFYTQPFQPLAAINPEAAFGLLETVAVATDLHQPVTLADELIEGLLVSVTVQSVPRLPGLFR